MNIKPSYQLVVAEIGQTQDGKKLNPNDIYGKFLLDLIKDNTEKELTAIDSGEVDTEELESNLQYAIHEFKKALEVVRKINTIINS